MNESNRKQELYDFYLHGDAERSKAFADKCFALMDARFEDGMSVTAQKHPEKYPHLIVRVTGFSAKFTSLSREWQEELLSGNFYH
ncbi:MAG: hypothetical protein E7629_02625 [Ruminococcaceae bacterium]|nr:hypothetical protein [Oscillospiraceae bacterium]